MGTAAAGRTRRDGRRSRERRARRTRVGRRPRHAGRDGASPSEPAVTSIRARAARDAEDTCRARRRASGAATASTPVARGARTGRVRGARRDEAVTSQRPRQPVARADPTDRRSRYRARGGASPTERARAPVARGRGRSGQRTSERAAAPGDGRRRLRGAGAGRCPARTAGRLPHRVEPSGTGARGGRGTSSGSNPCGTGACEAGCQIRRRRQAGSGPAPGRTGGRLPRRVEPSGAGARAGRGTSSGSDPCGTGSCEAGCRFGAALDPCPARGSRAVAVGRRGFRTPDRGGSRGRRPGHGRGRRACGTAAARAS